MIFTPLVQAANPASTKPVAKQKALKHKDNFHEKKHQKINPSSLNLSSRIDKKNEFFAMLGVLASSIVLPEILLRAYENDSHKKSSFYS